MKKTPLTPDEILDHFLLKEIDYVNDYYSAMADINILFHNRLLDDEAIKDKREDIFLFIQQIQQLFIDLKDRDRNDRCVKKKFAVDIVNRFALCSETNMDFEEVIDRITWFNELLLSLTILSFKSAHELSNDENEMQIRKENIEFFIDMLAEFQMNLKRYYIETRNSKKEGRTEITSAA